jgi:hypothetical protein
MSLLQKRKDNARAIAEGKFIEITLKNEGQEINQAIDKAMSSFRSAFWRDKGMIVRGNTLEYRHKKQHRFNDMKTRTSKSKGTIRKKRNIIHNKIIYGHLNNIARELSFGFTDAVVAELKKLEE